MRSDAFREWTCPMRLWHLQILARFLLSLSEGDSDANLVDADPVVKMSGEIVSRECYAFGHLFPGSPLKVEAPVEFFDPLTGR